MWCLAHHKNLKGLTLVITLVWNLFPAVSPKVDQNHLGEDQLNSIKLGFQLKKRRNPNEEEEAQMEKRRKTDDISDLETAKVPKK